MTPLNFFGKKSFLPTSKKMKVGSLLFIFFSTVLALYFGVFQGALLPEVIDISPRSAQAACASTDYACLSCQGVSCGSFCSGVTYYYNGYCSWGSCYYSTQSNSPTCGYASVCTPGSTRTRYLGESRPCGTACTSETQTCNSTGTAWSGSYTATSCSASSRTRYSALTSACGNWSYASQTQYCQWDGNWSGSYTLTSPPSLSVRTRYYAYTSACGTYDWNDEEQYCQSTGSWSPNNYSLTSQPSVTTRTRYADATSACGVYGTLSQTQYCQFEGTFSGTYTNTTPSSASSRVRYAALTSACGTYGSASQTQYCQSTGSWSPSTYTLTSAPSASTRTRYQTSSVACGQSCSYETQTCQSSGAWSGSYGYSSCSVDVCAPVTPSAPTLSGSTVNSISISWSSVSNALEYSIYRNGTYLGYVSYLDPLSYTLTGLSCGTNYSITISATGSGGTSSQSSPLNASTATCPDTTPPSISASGSSSSWYSSTPTITVSASDSGGSGLSVVRYNWDVGISYCLAGGGSNVSTSNGATISMPSAGSHTLYICAYDGVGNDATWSGAYKLDTTTPTSSDDSPGLTTSSPLDVNVYVSNTGPSDLDYISWCMVYSPNTCDPTVICGASCGGTTGIDCACGGTSGGLDHTDLGYPSNMFLNCSDGSTCSTVNFRYYAYDNAGNNGSVGSGSFRIDRQAPSSPSVSASTLSNSSIRWQITNSPSDTGGLSSTPYGIATSAGGTYSWQSSKTFDVSGLSTCTSYTRYIKVRDSLGNETSAVSASATTDGCDSTPPTISRSGSSSSWTTSASVTATASDASGVSYVRHCWANTGVMPPCDPGTSSANTFTNGATLTQTTSGSSWYACFRSRDAYGNWTPAITSGNYASYCWGPMSVDTTAPTPNPPSPSESSTGADFISVVMGTAGSDAHSGMNSSPYNYAINGSWSGWTSSASQSFSSLSCENTYSISGKLRDAMGNETSAGSTNITTGSCVVPPAAVSSVIATEKNGASISVSWTNVGASGYRVYLRGGRSNPNATTLISDTAGVTIPSQAGLDCPGAYSIAVVAYNDDASIGGVDSSCTNAFSGGILSGATAPSNKKCSSAVTTTVNVTSCTRGFLFE